MDPFKYELNIFTVKKKSPADMVGFTAKLDRFNNMVVIEVEKESLMDAAGLRVNDIIVAVNHRRVSTIQEIQKMIKGSLEIRLVVSRKRLVPIHPDLVKPFNRNRDPDCKYLLIRFDPGNSGTDLGLEFGTFDGRLSIMKVSDGLGKQANLLIHDRPLIVSIGEIEIMTVEEITGILNNAGFEPTDWIFERPTGKGAVRLTGPGAPSADRK